MRALLAVAVALALAQAGAAGGEPLARGDAAWAERALEQQDGRARPGPVRAAVEAYESAVAAEPGSLEARWKLLRALWFAGEFASESSAEALGFYERGRALARPWTEELAERLGRPTLEQAAAGAGHLADRLAPGEARHAAELYFWAAVHVGAWSRSAGLLQAVRAGAANHLYEYTVFSIALDPAVEGGGALRLLSRLHAQLPRVPLLSGFVDRSQALPLAERAAGEYPEHPGNAYLLGLTLLELAPARRDEGVALVEATARLEPRPDHVVEDSAVRRSARERFEVERVQIGARNQEEANGHPDRRQGAV